LPGLTSAKRPSRSPRIGPRGARMDRPHGLDRVGLLRTLVRAVALPPGEPQSKAGWVPRAALHPVEGHLHDQLGSHVDREVVAVSLELEEPLGLPSEHLVGHSLERLSKHHVPPGCRVAGSQVEVAEPALPPTVPPFPRPPCPHSPASTTRSSVCARLTFSQLAPRRPASYGASGALTITPSWPRSSAPPRNVSAPFWLAVPILSTCSSPGMRASRAAIRSRFGRSMRSSPSRCRTSKKKDERGTVRRSCGTAIARAT